MSSSSRLIFVPAKNTGEKKEKKSVIYYPNLGAIIGDGLVLELSPLTVPVTT